MVPARRGCRRQLAGHGHAVDDDGQAGALADMFEQRGRLRPGVGLERRLQAAGGRPVPLGT